MALSEALLFEFDNEMAHTRKTLERVPEDEPDWKPHEKSMTIARLATHLAELPRWAVDTIEADSFDVAPPGAPHRPPAWQTTRNALLDLFDRNVVAARAAIGRSSDEDLAQPWTLLAGGKQVFTLPKIAVLRSYVMNHAIHHRAQLGVYLRLNDIPVPAIYGPSADEQGM